MSRTSSRLIPGIFSAVLECGGLPPLCRPRACSRSFRLGAQFRPASCRTPKQRNVATNKNPWSPSPEPATGLRNSPGCEPNAVVCRRGQPRWPTWAERRSALRRMTRPDYWLTKSGNLGVDRARGDPAPHKSLLLLVLCDPVEKASLSHDVLPYRRQHC